MTKIKDLPKACPVAKLVSATGVKRLKKTCAICGHKIKVVLYKNHHYRGGNFFGRIPLCSKKETDKAIKAGFRLWQCQNSIFCVFKKDPKPYAYAEYWECQKCYWGK